MARTKKHPDFLLVDQSPVPYEVAAEVYLVLRGAKQKASSIYRGTLPAAQPLLRRYGKHNQAQIHRMYPTISNPVNHSEHDLHTDDGRPLPRWAVGVDSGLNTDHDRQAIQDSAARRHWKVKHHYNRGVEYHHWCFVEQPHSNSRVTKTRLLITRRMLTLQTRIAMRGHW